jgi:hypothetical protein
MASDSAGIGNETPEGVLSGVGAIKVDAILGKILAGW